MSLFTHHRRSHWHSPLAEPISDICNRMALKQTRGDTGLAIAEITLLYSPQDIREMKINFSRKIDSFTPEYRKELEETVAVFLDGTFQMVRLMNQQGSFTAMIDPVADSAVEYWKMVAEHCSTGDERSDNLRFLKYLLSGFCMFVQEIPGHPVGMPFPGGDRVSYVDGIYYCPVRTKANDVDAALCPYCPALQTPEVGYLKPPVKGSKHRKQEYIKNMYDYHHFNG